MVLLLVGLVLFGIYHFSAISTERERTAIVYKQLVLARHNLATMCACPVERADVDVEPPNGGQSQDDEDEDEDENDDVAEEFVDRLIPQSALFEEQYIAVVVEPRENPFLVPAVLNVLANLPRTWRVQVFHSSENYKWLANSRLSDYEAEGRVIFSQVHVPSSRTGYSDMLKTIEFWERVRGEKVLIFQADSVLCSASPFKVDHFLEYDYIGASWPHRPGGMDVGNGGVSIRTRSVMIKAVQAALGQFRDSEDLLFATFVPKVGGRVAPRESADEWATEMRWNPSAPLPFAVHKPQFWIDNPNELPGLHDLYLRCPEAKMLPRTLERTAMWVDNARARGAWHPWEDFQNYQDHRSP